MYCYRAYSLSIRSEFTLPALIPDDRACDVVIRRGSVLVSAPKNNFQGGCFHAANNEAYLYWEDFGTLVVRNGSEIIVDPLPDTSEKVVIHVILGMGLATILHQRGLIVIHASAIAINDVAVAFVGGKGWGKSTMAAALNACGYAVVADDVLAIDMENDECPIVYPGFPQLKLWPESAASLGVDPESLPHVIPVTQKRAQSVKDGFSQTSLPLKRIYILAKRQRQKIERIELQQALAEIIGHTHSTVTRILEHTGATAEYFSKCARLVDSVPICRMSRPPSLDRLNDLAKWVEKDIVESINKDKPTPNI
jgi:hypothetical protein